jgi:hypothetical protein
MSKKDRTINIETCKHETLTFEGYFAHDHTVMPHLCKMYSCQTCHGIVMICKDKKGLPTVHLNIAHVKIPVGLLAPRETKRAKK